MSETLGGTHAVSDTSAASTSRTRGLGRCDPQQFSKDKEKGEKSNNKTGKQNAFTGSGKSEGAQGV